MVLIVTFSRMSTGINGHSKLICLFSNTYIGFTLLSEFRSKHTYINKVVTYTAAKPRWVCILKGTYTFCIFVNSIRWTTYMKYT